MMLKSNRFAAAIVAGMIVALVCLLAVPADAGVPVQEQPCPTESYVVSAPPVTTACVTAQQYEVKTKTKRVGLLKRIGIGVRAAREAKGTVETRTWLEPARQQQVALYTASAPAPVYYYQQAPAVESHCLGADDCD